VVELSSSSEGWSNFERHVSAGCKNFVKVKFSKTWSPDRQDHQRLRPREAAGAVGEAGRRLGAAIRVGAATETEMKEKKARVEHARHATRAAVEEGIVPGGGVVLARCVPALERMKVDGDEQIGVNILKRALQEPLRQIAENAGEEGRDCSGQGARLEGPELRSTTGGRARSHEGRACVPLTHAGSISSLMLTTEALVAEIPVEKKGAPAGGGHGGGMGEVYLDGAVSEKRERLDA
jgi:hypothetical protein